MEPVADSEEGTDWSAHLTSMLSFPMAAEPPTAPDENEEASVSAALDAAAAAEASGVEGSSTTTATENEAASVNVTAEGAAACDGTTETDANADGDVGWSASLSSMLPTFAMGDEASDVQTEAENALDTAENEAMDAALATAEVRHQSRCSASRTLISRVLITCRAPSYAGPVRCRRRRHCCGQGCRGQASSGAVGGACTGTEGGKS